MYNTNAVNVFSKLRAEKSDNHPPNNSETQSTDERAKKHLLNDPVPVGHWEKKICAYFAYHYAFTDSSWLAARGSDTKQVYRGLAG